MFSVGFGGGAAFAAVLGAVGATSEFRHRTAVSTFLCTPRRSRVVIAKLITYGLAGLGFGAACAAASIALAVPYLQAKGIEVALSANGIPATLGAVVVAVALYAVIGTGLGALLREQVATTVGLLVYLFVAEPVITRVGASLEWTTWLPGSAAGAMLDVSQAGQVYLPAWQGGLVLAGYAAVLAVAGAVALARRDVH